jgi:hypothetical protein
MENEKLKEKDKYFLTEREFLFNKQKLKELSLMKDTTLNSLMT